MNTEASEIRVEGIAVRVLRKDIKNLHLGVYPPNGRVRVAAPLAVSDDAVRLAIVGRLGWIKKQRATFAAQTRESAREMVSGESHYFLGRRYRLRVVLDVGPSRVVQQNRTRLELRVSLGADAKVRERALQRWYRQRLRELIPPLLEKWEPIVGVRVAFWGIKRMKTRWGSCNDVARRVWLNLELAKKPAACLEYILVHEMVHLKERHHTDQFRQYMDRFMPQWRLRREELNRAPLAHEEWRY
jgi:predicted metal-dependent hydrolase